MLHMPSLPHPVTACKPCQKHGVLPFMHKLRMQAQSNAYHAPCLRDLLPKQVATSPFASLKQGSPVTTQMLELTTWHTHPLQQKHPKHCVVPLAYKVVCTASHATVRVPKLAALQEQQLRTQALQPFTMPPPTRGIVGTSRFAQRMKAKVMQAAKDPLRLPPLTPHLQTEWSCCCCADCVAADTVAAAASAPAACSLYCYMYRFCCWSCAQQHCCC